MSTREELLKEAYNWNIDLGDYGEEGATAETTEMGNLILDLMAEFIKNRNWGGHGYTIDTFPFPEGFYIYLDETPGRYRSEAMRVQIENGELFYRPYEDGDPSTGNPKTRNTFLTFL
jgi:hypothetical protein